MRRLPRRGRGNRTDGPKLAAAGIFAACRCASLLYAGGRPGGSASSYLFALNVGPVINIPVTKDWGGYILFGGGYYHRWGTLSSNATVPGFVLHSVLYMVDGLRGCEYSGEWKFYHFRPKPLRLRRGGGDHAQDAQWVQLYAEFRLMHGSGNGTTTDVRPITLGVRW